MTPHLRHLTDSELVALIRANGFATHVEEVLCVRLEQAIARIEQLAYALPHRVNSNTTPTNHKE